VRRTGGGLTVNSVRAEFAPGFHVVEGVRVHRFTDSVARFMQGALVTITTATKRMAGKAVGSLLSKTRKQLTGFCNSNLDK
jgi:hypothetical protein